ncbi:GNAT family N-acetyltransferase [Roseateles saccharophilus]|uniref:GNAT family N-acetyltransferase n=1 Tax=Roseateles saccharophilus TaxID=304 RepID=UPI00104F2A16|nr:GNAT family N-acetyltransferase [Roseateles saccharophilus]MDG0833528.1 GNAT family N-acetyltransferase [Roseateles saccharophilus]
MSGTVHEFKIEHYDQAIALWKRTPGIGLSSADAHECIAGSLGRNPGLSFVVRIDGIVAGTILCGHDGRRGLIHHLVVDPQFRRAGHGRMLLTAALEGLRAEGIDKAHLLVFRSNLDGLAFWRRVSVERVELALFSISMK